MGKRRDKFISSVMLSSTNKIAFIALSLMLLGIYRMGIENGEIHSVDSMRTEQLRTVESATGIASGTDSSSDQGRAELNGATSAARSDDQTHAEEEKFLMVVAHPDDETLWGGDFLALHGPETHVVVTSGDSRISSTRKAEFESVRDFFGYHGEFLMGRDAFKEFPLESDIRERITELVCSRKWEKIITHGPDGEYGHPMHQAVHGAVADAVKECCKNADTLFVFHPFPPGSEPGSEPFSETKTSALNLYQSQKYVVFRAFGDWNERIVPITDYDYETANRYCREREIPRNTCHLHILLNSTNPEEFAERYHLLYPPENDFAFRSRGVGC